MPKNIQDEIRQLIMPLSTPEHPDTERLLMVAEEPFGDIWDDPVDDHWDEFFKEKE